MIWKLKKLFGIERDQIIYSILKIPLNPIIVFPFDDYRMFIRVDTFLCYIFGIFSSFYDDSNRIVFLVDLLDF